MQHGPGLSSVSTRGSRDLALGEIVRYKCTHDGNAPSVRAIAQAIGLTSTPAFEQIKALERAGLIQRTAGGIAVIGGSWFPPLSLLHYVVPDDPLVYQQRARIRDLERLVENLQTALSRVLEARRLTAESAAAD